MRTQTSSLIPLMRVSDLMQVLRSRGYTPTRLRKALIAAGFEEGVLDEPKGYLQVDEVWRLFSANLMILDDELTGQGVRPVPVGTMEIIVGRIMHATTVKEAIEEFVRCARIVYPEPRFMLTLRNDALHFTIRFEPETTEVQQIFLELTSIPIHCTFCWLADSLLDLQRYRTSTARSENAAQLTGIFGCPVEFGGSGVDLVYDLRQLEIPTAQRTIQSWRQDIYDILTAMLERKQSGLAQSDVTSYVKHSIRSGVQSQDLIAGSLGMSAATLRRRLGIEQLSFRKLRDLVLKEDAPQLLQAGYTVEVVAERLGYSEPRSFRRAFERCFGMSPVQYRDSLILG